MNTVFSPRNARLGEGKWGEPFGVGGREPLAGLQGMTMATFFPFFPKKWIFYQKKPQKAFY